MGEGLATIIVEPCSLVREALISLMSSRCYHVVCGVASTADIGNSLCVADAPRLVILGALPAEEASAAASSIRKLWPQAKIIFLFEHASPADFQTLLASEIDGCIPLFASPDTLIGTLQQIVAADLRILIRGTTTCSSMSRTTGWQEETDAASRPVLALPTARLPIAEVVTKEAGNSVVDGAYSIRNFHSLSKREEQILKGLVRGHSNKMIARTCDVTEATIKVHMKSILKKIRVSNRTQAAIWALEQGYCADNDLKRQAKTATAAQRSSKDGWVEASPSTAVEMAAE
jgi:two-component system nitrate/nitrite response regulator NarL